MAWFRIDDHLYSHPKWIGASKGSRALWASAGSWSAGQLLDGFVPASVLPILGGNRREATELVEAGLWAVDTDGWRFHDWQDYQPTRRAVMDKRRKDAERIADWRARKDAERGSAHAQ